jgi:hypothetical protein
MRSDRHLWTGLCGVVNCKHWQDCGIPSGGCCSAGLYGGRPSLGVCGVCEHHTDRPNAAKIVAALPKIVQATVTAESEMSRRRLEVCKACDKWTGHTCTICGCFTRLKVRLPAEACPIGKWAAEG